MSTANNVRRFFLCTGECVKAEELSAYPRSHIIGELYYINEGGINITALARYETSLSTQSIPPIRIEIDSYTIGDARGIKCRFHQCRNRKDWEIGKAAVRQLLQRHARAML